MLAVLEHLDRPKEIIQECYRILKNNGVLLITVPSPRNRFLLNLLAKFNLVRPEMIAQHKHYFTHIDLRKLYSDAGFKIIEIYSFQLGFNTIVRAIK